MQVSGSSSVQIVEEPIHIINIGLKDPELCKDSDEIIARRLSKLMESKVYSAYFTHSVTHSLTREMS